MKTLLIFIALLGTLNFQHTAKAQAKMKKESDLVKTRRIVLDSIDKQAIAPTALKESYNLNRKNWLNATFPEQKIVLQNGIEASYSTSDNNKTKALLTKLFSISPVDFLLGMRGIEGVITIKATKVSWVKREDIQELIKLVNINIITPEIKQYDLMNDRRKTPLKPTYIKTPLGINALNLIQNYLNEIFPSGDTPSYQSVKDWYDSGKPRESYKYELYVPIVGRDPLIRRNSKKN